MVSRYLPSPANQIDNMTGLLTPWASTPFNFTSLGTGAGTLYHGIGVGGEVKLTTEASGQLKLRVGSTEVRD